MQSPRIEREHWEESSLVTAAARASNARRAHPELECEIRTAFQRDRDRITHSQAFRRLKSKTQVFLPPAGDHVRTRLTHTLEVTQIARTISRALRLNEDLTEAIGLGHDLGHTPFGHAGERALADVFPAFRHNEQSLRVVEVIEKDGQGLNLTDMVRDGILRHSKPIQHITGDIAGRPQTAEAQIVKISDGIAYINHDLDDAIRAELLTTSQLPRDAIDVLGATHSQRINTLVTDVIRTSAPYLDEEVDGRQVIHMSENIVGAANSLRTYLFNEVYDPINQLPSTKNAMKMVQDLYHHFCRYPDQLPPQLHSRDDESIERRVADFIAGMTDQYASRMCQSLFIPSFEEV